MPISAEDARLAQAAAQAAKRARVVALVCVVCGGPFETTGDRAAARVCSPPCKRAHKAAYARAWKEKNRERWRAAKRRRDWSAPAICRSCRDEWWPSVKKGPVHACCPGCRQPKPKLRRVPVPERVRRRQRYREDPAFRETQLEKRRRAWRENPERERRKVWEWSIRKKFGSPSEGLMALLEERRQLIRDLRDAPANRCRVCGVVIRRANVLCADSRCNLEFGRRRNR
jgi:predicted nucleic acid-binding Zn ribbon protein